MARAVYQHELGDQDFAWLLTRFQEAHPEYCFIESVSLPAVFIKGELPPMQTEIVAPTEGQEASAGVAPENDPLVFGKVPPK